MQRPWKLCEAGVPSTFGKVTSPDSRHRPARESILLEETPSGAAHEDEARHLFFDPCLGPGLDLQLHHLDVLAVLLVLVRLVRAGVAPVRAGARSALVRLVVLDGVGLAGAG